jgi:hypothetical protein
MINILKTNMQHKDISSKILCLLWKQAKYAFIRTIKPCLKFKKWSNSYIYSNEHTFWLQEINMKDLTSGLPDAAHAPHIHPNTEDWWKGNNSELLTDFLPSFKINMQVIKNYINTRISHRFNTNNVCRFENRSKITPIVITCILPRGGF